MHGRREPTDVHSIQRSYADHRQRELSFEVGDYVYLKVLAMRWL
jgi:hypothetical protein